MKTAKPILFSLLLANAFSHGAASGVVYDRSGAALERVVVRWQPVGAAGHLDTTGRDGRWSFDALSLGGHGAGSSVRLEGQELVVTQEAATVVEVDALSADGRQRSLFHRGCAAGTVHIALPRLSSSESFLRVRSASGERILPVILPGVASTPVRAGAARAAEAASDTFVFTKSGFVEARRLLPSVTDTSIVVILDSVNQPPVLTRLASTKDTTVSASVASVTLGWKVQDQQSVTVTMNGVPAASVNGVYSVTASLAVGANKFKLVAVDALGERSSDSVVIVRAALDSFAAIWKIDSANQAVLVDQSGHGLALAKVDGQSGRWIRAFDSTLMARKPSGKILFSAKVYLTSYPDSNLFNKTAMVMGFYADLGMAVTSRGQLVATGQKGDDGAYDWYGPRTINGAVPLNKWTTLAVGADQATGEMYAWIDGKPVQLYVEQEVAGSKIRATAWDFTIGYNSRDGQPFSGKIAEVKVIDRFIYGAGLPVLVEPCIQNQCRQLLAPKAFWHPDSANQPKLVDKSASGLDLAKVATGAWARAVDPKLVAAQPSGRILYSAEVKMATYPAATTYNKMAVVMGFYEGMKMGITTTGQLVVAGQKDNSGSYTWYSVRSEAGSVPLGRWTRLAVGCDQTTGEFSAWIDGQPVKLYAATTVAGNRIRVATTNFALGKDAHDDGQEFVGSIGDVKIWNEFVDGPGLAVGLDPTIAD